MLRVIRHYLPIRKAILIASETLLLTLVISLWMTAHLWDPTDFVREKLFSDIPAMDVRDAILRCVYSSILLAAVAQIAISFNELYNVRVSSSRYDRAARFVEAAGSALFLTLVAVVLAHTWGLKQILDFPPQSLSQRVQTLVFAMLSSFVVLYYWRSLFHATLRRVQFGDRALILGSGRAARALATEILERPDTGFVLLGLLPDAHPVANRASIPGSTSAGATGKSRALWSEPDNPAPRPRAIDAGKTIGTAALASTPAEDLIAARGLILEPLQSMQDARREDHAHDEELAARTLTSDSSRTLFELVHEMKIDLVIVALEDRRNNLPIEDLLRCRLDGVSVREQESVYEQITGKIAVEALRPSYLIFNEGFSRLPWAELSKRAVDLVMSVVLFLLTWPLMIATAIVVRLDSPGPILFTQERVGRDGKLFTLLKFRSMRADAEKQSGPVWAAQNDPRITRSGRFIRKTRLDELPQIFNILAGHMSVVGPRPERQHFVDDLTKRIPYFKQRHIVKPGLTGWAQINYRYGNSFEDAVQKLQYDLFYIKNQSLLFDLSILFNTVKIVILRKGT